MLSAPEDAGINAADHFADLPPPPPKRLPGQCFHMNIAVLGDTGVGKSLLTERFAAVESYDRLLRGARTTAGDALFCYDYELVRAANSPTGSALKPTADNSSYVPTQLLDVSTRTRNASKRPVSFATEAFDVASPTTANATTSAAGNPSSAASPYGSPTYTSPMLTSPGGTVGVAGRVVRDGNSPATIQPPIEAIIASASATASVSTTNRYAAPIAAAATTTSTAAPTPSSAPITEIPFMVNYRKGSIFGSSNDDIFGGSARGRSGGMSLSLGRGGGGVAGANTASTTSNNPAALFPTGRATSTSLLNTNAASPTAQSSSANATISKIIRKDFISSASIGLSAKEAETVFEAVPEVGRKYEATESMAMRRVNINVRGCVEAALHRVYLLDTPGDEDRLSIIGGLFQQKTLEGGLHGVIIMCDPTIDEYFPKPSNGRVSRLVRDKDDIPTPPVPSLAIANSITGGRRTSLILNQGALLPLGGGGNTDTGNTTPHAAQHTSRGRTSTRFSLAPNTSRPDGSRRESLVNTARRTSMNSGPFSGGASSDPLSAGAGGGADDNDSGEEFTTRDGRFDVILSPSTPTLETFAAAVADHHSRRNTEVFNSPRDPFVLEPTDTPSSAPTAESHSLQHNGLNDGGGYGGGASDEGTSTTPQKPLTFTTLLTKDPDAVAFEGVSPKSAAAFSVKDVPQYLHRPMKMLHLCQRYEVPAVIMHVGDPPNPTAYEYLLHRYDAVIFRAMTLHDTKVQTKEKEAQRRQSVAPNNNTAGGQRNDSTASASSSTSYIDEEKHKVFLMQARSLVDFVQYVHSFKVEVERQVQEEYDERVKELERLRNRCYSKRLAEVIPRPLKYAFHTDVAADMFTNSNNTAATSVGAGSRSFDTAAGGGNTLTTLTNAPTAADHILKVRLLGAPCSGKTSFLHALLDDHRVTTYTPTEELDVATCVVELKGRRSLKKLLRARAGLPNRRGARNNKSGTNTNTGTQQQQQYSLQRRGSGQNLIEAPPRESFMAFAGTAALSANPSFNFERGGNGPSFTPTGGNNPLAVAGDGRSAQRHHHQALKRAVSIGETSAVSIEEGGGSTAPPSVANGRGGYTDGAGGYCTPTAGRRFIGNNTITNSSGNYNYNNANPNVMSMGPSGALGLMSSPPQTNAYQHRGTIGAAQGRFLGQNSTRTAKTATERTLDNEIGLGSQFTNKSTKQLLEQEALQTGTRSTNLKLGFRGMLMMSGGVGGNRRSDANSTASSAAMLHNSRPSSAGSRNGGDTSKGSVATPKHAVTVPSTIRGVSGATSPSTSPIGGHGGMLSATDVIGTLNSDSISEATREVILATASGCRSAPSGKEDGDILADALVGKSVDTKAMLTAAKAKAKATIAELREKARNEFRNGPNAHAVGQKSTIDAGATTWMETNGMSPNRSLKPAFLTESQMANHNDNNSPMRALGGSMRRLNNHNNGAAASFISIDDINNSGGLRNGAVGSANFSNTNVFGNQTVSEGAAITTPMSAHLGGGGLLLNGSGGQQTTQTPTTMRRIGSVANILQNRNGSFAGNQNQAAVGTPHRGFYPNPSDTGGGNGVPTTIANGHNPLIRQGSALRGQAMMAVRRSIASDLNSEGTSESDGSDDDSDEDDDPNIDAFGGKTYDNDDDIPSFLGGVETDTARLLGSERLARAKAAADLANRNELENRDTTVRITFYNGQRKRAGFHSTSIFGEAGNLIPTLSVGVAGGDGNSDRPGSGATGTTRTTNSALGTRSIAAMRSSDAAAAIQSLRRAKLGDIPPFNVVVLFVDATAGKAGLKDAADAIAEEPTASHILCVLTKSEGTAVHRDSKIPSKEARKPRQFRRYSVADSLATRHGAHHYQRASQQMGNSDDDDNNGGDLNDHADEALRSYTFSPTGTATSTRKRDTAVTSMRRYLHPDDELSFEDFDNFAGRLGAYSAVIDARDCQRDLISRFITAIVTSEAKLKGRIQRRVFAELEPSKRMALADSIYNAIVEAPHEGFPATITNTGALTNFTNQGVRPLTTNVPYSNLPPKVSSPMRSRRNNNNATSVLTPQIGYGPSSAGVSPPSFAFTPSALPLGNNGTTPSPGRTGGRGGASNTVSPAGIDSRRRQSTVTFNVAANATGAAVVPNLGGRSPSSLHPASSNTNWSSANSTTMTIDTNRLVASVGGLHYQPPSSDFALRDLFREIDTNQDGYIDGAEMRKLYDTFDRAQLGSFKSAVVAVLERAGRGPEAQLLLDASASEMAGARMARQQHELLYGAAAGEKKAAGGSITAVGGAIDDYGGALSTVASIVGRSSVASPTLRPSSASIDSTGRSGAYGGVSGPYRTTVAPISPLRRVARRIGGHNNYDVTSSIDATSAAPMALSASMASTSAVGSGRSPVTASGGGYESGASSKTNTPMARHRGSPSSRAGSPSTAAIAPPKELTLKEMLEPLNAFLNQNTMDQYNRSSPSLAAGNDNKKKGGGGSSSVSLSKDGTVAGGNGDAATTTSGLLARLAEVERGGPVIRGMNSNADSTTDLPPLRSTILTAAEEKQRKDSVIRAEIATGFESEFDKMIHQYNSNGGGSNSAGGGGKAPSRARGAAAPHLRVVSNLRGELGRSDEVRGRKLQGTTAAINDDHDPSNGGANNPALLSTSINFNTLLGRSSGAGGGVDGGADGSGMRASVSPNHASGGGVLSPHAAVKRQKAYSQLANAAGGANGGHHGKGKEGWLTVLMRIRLSFDEFAAIMMSVAKM